MKWLHRCVFLLVLMLVAVSASSAQTSPLGDRLPTLARGINLPFWFWYAPEDTTTRFLDEEFIMLKQMGISVVRIPIDLGFVFDPAAPNQLNAENLALIDAGFQRVQAAGLAIIVDLHSTSLEDSDAANYSGALENPAFVPVYVSFWSSFAAHINATYDPAITFIAPMNEPVFVDDPSLWPPIQDQLITAIRAAAPNFTIIATGALWSGLDTLIELTPLADDNIVYEFHFYEPFTFTHQGATWTLDEMAVLRGVPYPSSPEAVQPVLNTLAEGMSYDMVAWYGGERWDAAKIAERIGVVADWAETNGVPLICTEFGVYGQYAPFADRVQWITDVRTALEARSIGWAMWEYDDGFGMVTRDREANTVQPIAEIVAALGLQMP
jgi:endoglucanase